MTQTWGLVVPVKLLAVAKSRLGAYGDHGRAELALAFAEDVVAAALACEVVDRVVVVTDDPRAAAALAGPRVSVVPDAPDDGLNPALVHGAAALRVQDPSSAVAALSSDLPALRPEHLAAALRQVVGRGFVSDASGRGTTLLAAGPGHDLLPAYGHRSRDRHLASGAAELEAAPALRLDVDTPEDLAAALSLGVGPRTAVVAHALV